MNDPETPRLRLDRADPADQPVPWAKARIAWECASPGRQLPEHVGAWLDRMLDEPTRQTPREKEDPHADRRWLYRDAIHALSIGAGVDPPAVRTWRSVYARHVRTFAVGADPATQRVVVELEATTRILLHAATERTVTEGGVLLHHTYGVPYLPGSALKGALRNALSGRRRHFDLSRFSTKGGREAVDELLGKGNSGVDDHAGLVDILDALWIPDRPSGVTGSWSPLDMDVVTPHHTKLVASGPTDMDAPVPTHRLTLAPGARFRVVLEASPEFPGEWLRWLGEEVLPAALATDGLGAWTSAGYGRLDRVGVQRAPAMPVRVAPAAASVKWTPAELARKPNTGELTARLTDGRVARALRDRAITLLDSLPGKDVDALRGGRALRVEVQVEPLGKSWDIVAIRPKPVV